MYYEDAIHETFYSNDRNHRAVIRTDFDAEAPDGDYFGTVLVGDEGQFHTLAQSYSASRRGVDFADTLDVLWGDLRDMEAVEKVLRGKLNICEDCGEAIDSFYANAECEGSEDGYHVRSHDFSDNPIVGFDYFDGRHGEKVVNIVTLFDLREWGHDSLEAFRTANPDTDPSAHNLDEFREWLDGAVYRVDLEERIVELTHFHTQKTFAEGRDPVRIASHETWESTGDDDCGGFYGTDRAVEYAEEIIGYANKEEAA